MLLPKKVKFRKQHRGKRGGVATRTNLVSLAFVLAGEEFNYEKSVHTKENPTEYYLKVEKDNEIYEYYYTPDKLPRNLAIISEIMLSPWQKELKKYNFQV